MRKERDEKLLMLRIYTQLFSISILIIILVNSFLRNGDKTLKYKIFKALVVSSIINLCLELLSWVFIGRDAWFLTFAINILYFLTTPFSALLWAVYAYVIVSKNEASLKKMILIFLIPYILDIAAVVSFPFTDLFFSAQYHNGFVQGKLYPLHYVSSFVYLFWALFYVYVNRKKVEHYEIATLLIFPVSPIIGGILQYTYSEISTVWSTLTLSLIIVYVNIQNKFINVDPITGAYSRTYLDYVLNNKYIHIKNWKSYPTFSGVFLDLDRFKSVNDNYGHIEGDIALKNTKNLIQSCLDKKDFVCRFAGDEFVIILDTSDYSKIKEFLQNLEKVFVDFNEKSEKPYNLSFSYGYMVYERSLQMKPEDFLKTIDKMMLQNKVNKKLGEN